MAAQIKGRQNDEYELFSEYRRTGDKRIRN